MPHPDDSGTGGEFQIHENKGQVQQVNKTLGRQVPEANDGGVVKTVPYKRNTFAMFLNTQNAIHSVSLRQAPTQYRRSVNIIGEFKDRGYGRMWRVNEIKS
jgi:copper(I)-binding protein